MNIIEAKVVGYEHDGGATSIFYYEIAGTSSETKPTDNVASGSIFTEVDTGDVYFYNEDAESWVKQFSFQG